MRISLEKSCIGRNCICSKELYKELYLLKDLWKEVYSWKELHLDKELYL